MINIVVGVDLYLWNCHPQRLNIFLFNICTGRWSHHFSQEAFHVSICKKNEDNSSIKPKHQALANWFCCASLGYLKFMTVDFLPLIWQKSYEPEVMHLSWHAIHFELLLEMLCLLLLSSCHKCSLPNYRLRIKTVTFTLLERQLTILKECIEAFFFSGQHWIILFYKEMFSLPAIIIKKEKKEKKKQVVGYINWCYSIKPQFVTATFE